MCEQVCVRERENESKHDCNEECVCVCVRAQGNVCMRVGGIECVKGFRNPRPMLNFLNAAIKGSRSIFSFSFIRWRNEKEKGNTAVFQITLI